MDDRTALMAAWISSLVCSNSNATLAIYCSWLMRPHWYSTVAPQKRSDLKVLIGSWTCFVEDWRSVFFNSTMMAL